MIDWKVYTNKSEIILNKEYIVHDGMHTYFAELRKYKDQLEWMDDVYPLKHIKYYSEINDPKGDLI
jgi:hypothetical protein